MSFNNILVALCFIPVIIYIVKLRNFKLNAKKMVVISMFSGLSFILSKIVFINYPQGGGVTLLSQLPILLVGILYDVEEGMTAGLIAGLLALMGGYIIHPIQLVLDFIIPQLILGFSGAIKTDKKLNLFLGCLLIIILKTMVHTVSGVVYFSEYAKAFNIGPWLYSILYNFSTSGVEGLLSCIVLMILPIERMRREANKNIKISA